MQPLPMLPPLRGGITGRIRRRRRYANTGRVLDLFAPHRISALAASGASPLDIALKIAGKSEAATQHILQVNDRGEAPSRSRVTVLRDGLLDDSIRGERWDIALEKTPAAAWKIGEVKRAWRCRRGEFLDRFTAASCP